MGGWETIEKVGDEGRGKEREEKKPNRIKELLKNIKPLAEGVAKGIAVVSTAAVVSCMTTFETPDRDSVEDMEAEGGDADIENEGDVASEDTDVHDSVLDVTDADMPVVCDTADEAMTVWITTDAVEIVGNVGIRYNGLDGDGNGLYDVLCGDVTVRSGIVAAPLTSEMVDVPEHSFSVTLRPNTVDATHSNVTVTVDAY